MLWRVSLMVSEERMNAMFETLDDLNEKLPRPTSSMQEVYDSRVIERYVSNAKTLRSEAFGCLMREGAKSLGQAWRRVTNRHLPGRSHPA